MAVATGFVVRGGVSLVAATLHVLFEICQFCVFVVDLVRRLGNSCQWSDGRCGSTTAGCIDPPRHAPHNECLPPIEFNVKHGGILPPF